MKHIRVGENNPAFITNEISVGHLSVPIEGLHNCFFQASHESHHLLQTSPLVLSESFGRKYVHCSGIMIPFQLMQDRNLIDQGFSRACGCCYNNMMTSMEVIDSFRLVRIELRDVF